MFEAIEPFLKSGMINEETRTAIAEAWESRLTEAREQIKAELREEFAGRYQHDKQVMVEAMDRMLTESLRAEIQEFTEEKQAMRADRVKFQNHMTESARRFDQFLTRKLAEEIQELRADREQYKNAVGKLENFVVKALSEEIQEFAQDKQRLVETRVQLVAETRKRLEQVKQDFVTRSARAVSETVEKGLKGELSQLKEDIHQARENMFGRKLFEAFASEFAVTHLNENQEIRQLKKSIQAREQQLSESRREIAQHQKIVEQKQRELRMIKESAERQATLNELLKPLNKEKAQVMSQLLESVQNEKLRSAYDKYLPAVLNNSVRERNVLVETRSVATGDKSASARAEPAANVVELKRLAGLK
jgi:hypothetical protein